MVSLFLDCNMYNYIAKPSPDKRDQVRELNEIIRRGLRKKNLLVVGGLQALWEILDAAPSQPKKYLQMARLFWEYVDGHLLKPRPWRLQEELRKKRPISKKHLYVDREVVKNGRASTDSIESVQEFVQRFEREDAREEWESIYQAVKNRIESSFPPNVKEAMGGLYDDLADLIQVSVERHCKDSGIDPEGLKATSLPFTYSHHGFPLTKIVERGLFNKPYEKGDDRDWAHFTDAAECDYLVSEDAAFRETCERVPAPHVQVVSFAKAIEILRPTS